MTVSGINELGCWQYSGGSIGGGGRHSHTVRGKQDWRMDLNPSCVSIYVPQYVHGIKR